MYCEKCGSLLSANGYCPVCSGNEATTVLEEPVYIESVPVEPAEPVKDPGKVMGIVSLILGILSLVVGSVCSCIGCGGFIFSITALVGIILGAIGMKKSKEAGFKNIMGMIGLILSIVSMVIIIIASVILLIGMIAGTAAEIGASSYYDYY